MNYHYSSFWRIVTTLFVISLVLSGCASDATEVAAPTVPQSGEPPPTEISPTTTVEPTRTDPVADTPTAPQPQVEIPEPIQIRFAPYQEPSVIAAPGVQHEPIAADLSNVNIPFVLSEEQLTRLAGDGFVVSPGSDKEFFTLYEQARYNNQPIFVTSDAMLHVYHLLFDKVLRTSEIEYFIPLLKDLNQAMLSQTDAYYQELQGTPWEQAAGRAVAFIGVASKLLDPSVPVPDYAADLVDAELALIEEAPGLMPSPLFPGLDLGEDYSQYIPRGHYTKSEELERYFKSMMWYGRMTFRIKTGNPEIGREETKAALLLVHALRNAQAGERPAQDAWDDLYHSTVFFVGRSDDLTPTQYAELIDTVYGEGAPVTSYNDKQLLDQFLHAAYQLPSPMILGMVIMDTEDVDEATKGMRFMGQRFVPDAYIFRQLIYRNVGDRENRRGLPMGLDIPSAMGSERAYQILDELGETAYPNYPQQMEKMRVWTGGLSEDDWTETLYNSWMYSFYPLLEVLGEGYPAFMQNESWLDKQLNTVLGSWAELKHDTILYAKQVYAELGGGPPPPPPLPPKGYVEPVPHFFARLAALTAMTSSGLEERNLMNEIDHQNLQRLEELSLSLKEIAEAELSLEPLTEDQERTIRFIGGELEHLTMAAADSDVDDPFAQKFMDEEPQAAVIADVATDPGSAQGLVVLEEGVGRINPIYVVVPITDDNGQIYLQVNKGGVFSYYEFVWPGNDRLTDEKWRQMLNDGTAPQPPKWVVSFYTDQGEYAELTNAVSGYQNLLTQIYWEPSAFFLDLNPGLEDYRPEIMSLAEEFHYVSHQLVNSNFRSFDLQADDLAVVTVREVWHDQMFEGDWPEYDAPVIAERGPYTLDTTYTVELIQTDYGPRWKVTRANYESPPPEW